MSKKNKPVSSQPKPEVKSQEEVKKVAQQERQKAQEEVQKVAQQERQKMADNIRKQVADAPVIQEKYAGLNLPRTNLTPKDAPVAKVKVQAASQPKNNKDWWDKLPQEWKEVFTKYNKISASPSEQEIQKVRSLNVLVLSYNKRITSLEPAAYMTDLEEIWCGNTKINSLEYVRNLPKLKRLYCSNTEIDSLEPLKNVKTLEELSCGRTNLTIDEVADFAKSRTTCKLVV